MLAFSITEAYHSNTLRQQHPLGAAGRRHSRAGRPALLYALGAVIWILASDLIAEALDIDSPAFSIAKGFVFVAATTIMLVLAFRRHEYEVATVIADLERADRERIAALEGVARTVGAMIEARDPYTAGHQQRVGEISRRIGRRMGLDAERVEGLRIGGYLHDVGKVAIDEAVLNFPGALSAEQREEVQQHSTAGYEILKSVPFAWPVAMIALQHHERLDGSGYPRGLRGDDILLDARIVAVADVFDAMTSERPYRDAGSAESALQLLVAGAGTHFDPAAVNALASLVADGIDLRPDPH